MCIFDCDPPVDGSIVFVVSRRDSTPRSGALVHVEAMGAAPGMEACGDMMWSKTELTPADVEFAQLYDGWSILALQWLEALRLCPPGGAGRFVDGGDRISRNGELPLNTGGGQLSGGRLHGFLQLWEACVQLRGEGAERQVPGPRPPGQLVRP